jgi:hypothetical protein
MKSYLAYLAIVISSIWMVMPTVAIAKPNSANATSQSPTTKKIAPTAALERLIVAPKLEASWFTPAFLKAADLSTIQFQRDVSLKLGRMRYGNYKSVQPIGGDKYRIIFDRAEPDAVVAQFQIDGSGRIAGIRLAEKSKEPNSQAQALAQVALDKSFKNNLRANGEPAPIINSLKQWLGNYQKVQKVDSTNYLGIFERGSVPISIDFKSDGSIEKYGMTCPNVTKPLSLSQAPADLQKVLAPCPNLK